MTLKLAICMAYYDNPSMLYRQIAALEGYDERTRREIELVVTDDGSPRWPAVAHAGPINLKLFRIGVDIRWNQDAARNICVKESSAPWLLLTDIDHFPPFETLNGILHQITADALGMRNVYRFERATVLDDSFTRFEPYKPHPNSWLMHRCTFEDIGGYDERLAGYYGTDADFRDSVNRYAREVHFLKHKLYRVPREIIPDASTTTYQRKAPLDVQLGKLIRDRNIKNPSWRPARFTNPYGKVFECSI